MNAMDKCAEGTARQVRVARVRAEEEALIAAHPHIRTSGVCWSVMLDVHKFFPWSGALVGLESFLAGWFISEKTQL